MGKRKAADEIDYWLEEPIAGSSRDGDGGSSSGTRQAGLGDEDADGTQVLESSDHTKFKKERSVRVATRIASPSSASPSNIPRVGADTAIFSIFNATLTAIVIGLQAFHGQRLVPVEGTDVYDFWFTTYGISALVTLIIETLITSSVPLLSALVKRSEPNPAALDVLMPIKQTADFNTNGVYVHIGRLGSVFLSQGFYIGSASASREQTRDGLGGQLGLLRRIYIDHGNPRERAKYPRSPHYRTLYLPDDGPDDHVYVALNMIYSDEVETILARNGIPVDELGGVERGAYKQALVRIMEAAWIQATGAFLGDMKMSELMKEQGVSLLPPIARGLNASAGLEGGSWDVEAHLARSKKGGEAAAEVMRAAHGSFAAHLDYHTTPENRKNGLIKAGKVTARGDWLKTAKTLFEGHYLVRNLRASDAPALCVTKASQELKGYAPGWLTEKNEIIWLMVPVDKSSSNKDWTRPPVDRTIWRLSIGSYDPSGQPLLASMTFQPFVLRSDIDIPVGKTAADMAMNSNIDPIIRGHDDNGSPEILIFSQANAIAWDVQSARGEFFGRRRASGGIDWNHAKRWEGFCGWVLMLHSLYAGKN